MPTSLGTPQFISRMARRIEDSVIETAGELAIVERTEAEGCIPAQLTLDEIPTHSCQYCAPLLEKVRDENPPWFALSSSSSDDAPPDLAWSSCIFFVSCLSILVKEDHRYFSRLVDAWHRSRDVQDKAKEQVPTISSVVSSIAQDPRYMDAQLRVKVEQNWLDIMWWNRYNAPLYGYFKSTTIDSLERFTTSRPTNIRPRSAESFFEVRRWLTECKLHHTKCRVHEQERKLMSPPSRIIKIQRSWGEDLHLTLADLPMQTSYVALSYCWGQDQSSFFTTLSNLRSRQEGFSCAELPQTIRDAIGICVELGYEYLWIDALCIVQDDEHQVQSELVLMADVYAGADLVLSAACAAASSEGFLQMRLPSVAVRGRQAGFVLNIDCMLGDDALSHRAWSLQEHRQAQRLLIYQRHRTIWHCAEKVLVDGGREEFDDITHYCPSFTISHGYRAMSEWLDIVSMYSTRQISRAEDRLPALAAIARDFARRLCVGESGYKAGIWFVPTQMEWRQFLWYRSPRSSQTNCQNDATQSLPSWSWSSCQYVINVLPELELNMIDQNVLQIEVDLRDASFVYGQVLSGRLTLRGLVLRITRQTLEDLGEDRSHFGRGTWYTESAVEINPEMYWDRPGVSTSKDVWLLPFGLNEWKDVCGLILAHQPDGHFTRLGVFENYKELERVPVRDVPAQTITIH